MDQPLQTSPAVVKLPEKRPNRCCEPDLSAATRTLGTDMVTDQICVRVVEGYELTN